MRKNLLLLLIACMIINTSIAQGPWLHKVYRASSPDGISWTTYPAPLFDTASVPGAVKNNSGTIFLYWVYMPNQSSVETLFVATSFDGVNFSAPQPVNISGSAITRRVDPNPVLLPNGDIRLYYIDFGTIPTQHMYSATSSDGINFTEDPGIRFTRNYITDPDIFMVNNSWVGFLSMPNLGFQMIRVTSNDGLSFTEDTTFNWNNGGISSTFLFGTNVYRTYYCGPGGINSATSPDGYNLSIEPGARINTGCDPTVVQMGTGSYMMYYKKSDPQGIAELSNDDRLEISPNPFSSWAIIRSAVPFEDAALEVYNPLGQRVRAYESLEGTELTINREDLPCGIYFARLVKNGAITASKKFVIIR
jgi:hypothetical protein